MGRDAEEYTPAELLDEAIDDAEVARIFLLAADYDTGPPDYDPALEYVEVVIVHLEEAQDLLRARFANRNANPSY